ncbi:MAG: bL35 family ribosomal protein [Caldisericota bacterium]|jgi:large subunit ribosomal protein L35|nr:bL35 family ribosomal protein [Caldisericota bacterium]
MAIRNKVTKIRTCRGAAKRFKVTGTGKLVAYGANHSHKLSKSNMSKKKLMLKKHVLTGADARNMKRLVPYLKG